MNTSLQNPANGYRVAAVVGRILLAQIFVLSGTGKIAAFALTAGVIAGKGLPAAEVLTALSIAVELGGGLAIVFGWKAREAAALIFLWMIPVTLIFHNPLGLDPALAKQTVIQLEKNLSIMGGLLVLLAFGAERFGVEGKQAPSGSPAPPRR